MKRTLLRNEITLFSTRTKKIQNRSLTKIELFDLFIGRIVLIAIIRFVLQIINRKPDAKIRTYFLSFEILV